MRFLLGAEGRREVVNELHFLAMSADGNRAGEGPPECGDSCDARWCGSGRCPTMIKRLFSSQLRVNMVSGVLVTFINIAVLAVAYPTYLYSLGYERYGVWLVLSTVLSFAQLGNLGVGHAVMKLVAEEYGRRDFRAVQEYVTSAMAILALSGAAALAVILLFRTQIVALFKLSEYNSSTASWLLPYIGSLSVYAMIVQALNATLSGLGRMDLANYAQTGGRVVMVTVATFLLARGRGIESLLLGSIASYLFVHMASVLLIRRNAPVHLFRRSNLSFSRVRRLLSFGSGVFGGSMLNMLISPFSKLMLSRYAGVNAVPIYEIAYTGSMQVRGLLEAGLRAMMPEVSRIGGEMTRAGKEKIELIDRHAVKLVAYCGAPFYGLMIASAPILLRLWLGSNMAPSLPTALRVSLLASFVSLACVPAYYILLGLGQVRHCFLGQGLLACVNVLVIGAFVWRHGQLSVGQTLLSTLIATGAASAYFIVQKRRILCLMPLHAAQYDLTTTDSPQ